MFCHSQRVLMAEIVSRFHFPNQPCMATIAFESVACSAPAAGARRPPSSGASNPAAQTPGAQSPSGAPTRRLFRTPARPRPGPAGATAKAAGQVVMKSFLLTMVLAINRWWFTCTKVWCPHRAAQPAIAPQLKATHSKQQRSTRQIHHISSSVSTWPACSPPTPLSGQMSCKIHHRTRCS